jgi:hypothetical protein
MTFDPKQFGATEAFDASQFGAKPVSDLASSIYTANEKPKAGALVDTVPGTLIHGAGKGVATSFKDLGEFGQFLANQTAGRVANFFTGKGFKPTEGALFKTPDQQKNGDIYSPDTTAGKAAADALVPQNPSEAVGYYGEKIAELLGPAGAKGFSALKDVLEGKAGFKALSHALEFGAPKVTPSMEEAALAKGTQGVQEGGIFTKAKIVLTPRTHSIADAINGVVDPGASDLKNIDLINQHVARTNDAVKSYIAEHKAPFNEAQLRSKLEATKADNAVVFASDPTLEKTYNALIDEFVSHVQSKDTAGLFAARQSFDKIPVVQKLLDGLQGAQGENLRRSAVLDIRRAANEYIADLLPEGSPYKSFMQKESRMLEAVGNKAENLRGNTVDKNAIQAMIKKNPYIGPLLKYIIPTGVAAAAGTAYINH